MLDPWYDSFNWEPEEIAYYRDLVRTKADPDKCSIRVNTIHSVKGAEADNVVVLMDITKQIYANLQNNPDSEYRVLYVACTRVKKNLFIVDSQSQHEYPLEVKV
jgi:superfamily I DNA/RNA helicase